MSEMPASSPEKLAPLFFPFEFNITDRLSGAVDADPNLTDLMLEDMNTFHEGLSIACSNVWAGWNDTEEFMNSYIDGCSIAYTLFVIQAGDKGLPEIDPDTIDDYFELLEGEVAESYYDSRYKLIKNEDNGFALALSHYTLRADKQMIAARERMFVFGAMVTYDILRHQFMTRDFLSGLTNLPEIEKPPGDTRAA